MVDSYPPPGHCQAPVLQFPVVSKFPTNLAGESVPPNQMVTYDYAMLDDRLVPIGLPSAPYTTADSTKSVVCGSRHGEFSWRCVGLLSRLATVPRRSCRWR